LRNASGCDRNLVLEDIKPNALVAELGLNEENMSAFLREDDILVCNSVDFFGWFTRNMEKLYKSAHIPEY
jgi:hypothetical protein